MENLGLVMLGLRSALRDDSSCSAVELTIGTKVRLPGEFFEEVNSKQTAQYISAYTQILSKCVNDLGYTKPRHPNNRATFVDPDLDTCSHVFIRNDTVRGPLQRPY